MLLFGSFYVFIDLDFECYYVGFVGGFGIILVLLIFKIVFVEELECWFILVYVNWQVVLIMFCEEFEDLKNWYFGWLQVIYILKSDVQEVELFIGCFDWEKLDELFVVVIWFQVIDVVFLCGLYGMMEIVCVGLIDYGVSVDWIKQEFFKFDQFGCLLQCGQVIDEVFIEEVLVMILIFDGIIWQICMVLGEIILQVVYWYDIEVFYFCCVGVCLICWGWILDGEVEMVVNYVFEDDEICDGYVLICQL